MGRILCWPPVTIKLRLGIYSRTSSSLVVYQIFQGIISGSGSVRYTVLRHLFCITPLRLQAVVDFSRTIWLVGRDGGGVFSSGGYGKIHKNCWLCLHFPRCFLRTGSSSSRGGSFLCRVAWAGFAWSVRLFCVSAGMTGLCFKIRNPSVKSKSTFVQDKD